MVAIGEHSASSSRPGLAFADRRVQVLGRRDLEALHSRRQRVLVVGLDEQVDVCTLDTDVHDPEVFAPGGGERGFADRAIGEPAAEVADRANGPQDHMDRIPCVQLRAGLVRRAGSLPLRLAAGAAPLATTLGEQLKLLALGASPWGAGHG